MLGLIPVLMFKDSLPSTSCALCALERAAIPRPSCVFDQLAVPRSVSLKCAGSAATNAHKLLARPDELCTHFVGGPRNTLDARAVTPQLSCHLCNSARLLACSAGWRLRGRLTIHTPITEPERAARKEYGCRWHASSGVAARSLALAMSAPLLFGG